MNERSTTRGLNKVVYIIIYWKDQDAKDVLSVNEKGIQ